MRLKLVRVLITLVSAIALFAASSSSVGLASAQQIAMDVTKAVLDKAFGGDKIGTVTITANDDHVVNIRANLTSPPDEGKVWEGWFVDAGGSDYKLSLGEFAKNGTLHVTEQMVNPYTYSQFVVSQEPFEDPDPKAAGASGGAELQTPFGR